eukprot:TRINITY_DN2599_c1_g1_i1.p2 TRINITY_DN2599_c1_g1~~TRINITY_DN2599_c1_g1_i1.p2  ORF type:complete len:228 (+),score=40.84 TRINITY_DN2599_c1_g1_i1:83-766(+)
MDADGADDMNGDEEEEEEEDGAGLDDDQLITQLLADPEAYLPKFEALALYASTLGLPHACAATLRVGLPASTPADDAGVVADLRASIDLAPHDPLTICRVPPLLDVQEREEALARLGFPSCSCPRCGVERGRGATLPVEDLRRVALVAEAEARHTDAIAAWQGIIARQPRDGEALHHRARCLGWADQWSAGRRSMREAAVLAPSDVTIQAAVRECGAYSHGGAALRR